LVREEEIAGQAFNREEGFEERKKLWASLFPKYPFEPSPQARTSKKGTPTDQPFDNRSIA
jgi:hypothetical protein